ncbi:MAG TPA: Maf family protein, partial [Anaerolineales bacterium]|nr:Maf family protein [Anaerolineales bacterium]
MPIKISESNLGHPSGMLRKGVSAAGRTEEVAVLESLPVTENPMLVLASNSPRRRQLLALAGWSFSVSAANVDESLHVNESPADYVLRLAETKARAVASQAHKDQIILAADTTVVDEGYILGKPKDAAEAVTMLTRLRGHTHQVYTGIALLLVSDGLLLTDHCITDVPMRKYSDEEIQAYVQTGDPLDKAGAYGIQHPQFRPVTEIKGCYASVMGLPMCRVIRLMRKMDIEPNTDFFLRCETLLEDDCAVSS